MRKSPDAFRTISEVAQDLDLPQHVLRFWETRFSQIKPMKRGGGRRYYRPDDVELLRGIRHLLYDQGYTIKGVQKILKEQGIRHVIDAVDDMAGVPNETGAAPDASGSVPQFNAPQEPNQLEVERPPLVRPVAPAPQARQQSPMQQAPALPANPAPLADQGARPASPQQLAAHIQTQPQPKLQPNPTAPQSVVRQVTTSQQVVAQAEPFVHYDNVTAPIDAQVPPSASQQPHPASPQTHPISPPHQEPLPEERELGQSIPQDLVRGEPKYLHGESATLTVEEARARYIEEKQKAGFFERLRGRSEPEQTGPGQTGMSRDDVRRLQSTLFELLECKRLLDQARNED